MARGRRALRRRRDRPRARPRSRSPRWPSPSPTASTTGTGRGDRRSPVHRPRPASWSSPGKNGLQLVAYKGAQPKGFTIDKVPQGWFVQNLNEFELVIAPDKAKNPGPNVNPSKSPIYDPRDYSNKIAIFRQSKDEKSPQGKTTEVGGADVILSKSERGMDTDPNGKMYPEPVRPDGD